MSKTVLPPPTHRAGLDGMWTKLRTVRSTGWSLVAMAAISLGLMWLITWAVMRRWDRLDREERTGILQTPLQVIVGRPVFVCQLVVAVLGVMVMSAEYTTGMIRSTL